MGRLAVAQIVPTGSTRPARARLRYLLPTLLLTLAAVAQNQPKDQNQPQVRVNYLNVCTPSADEQQEIRKALSSIPPPKFSGDFEVSRGQTSVPDADTASYVRVRHDFVNAVPFVAAQYSLSIDPKSMVEDLVFRSREAKDVIQIQLEDTVTGALDAKSVLITDTPVNRIKLERFGKSSVALARCEAVNQSAYEPLFRQASEAMSHYREALGIKRLVPGELTALGIKPSAQAARKSPPTTKP